MITCKETGNPLTGSVYAAARLNDQNRCVPLSPEVIDRIKALERLQGHRTYQTGGVGIYRAVVVGENGDSHLAFDHHQHLAFSISKKTLERCLPKTFEEFPHKE